MFALSYFFSVFAAWITVKKRCRFISVLLTSILLTLSLASYQSSIGCYCLIVISHILLSSKKDSYKFEDLKDIIIKVFVSIILGSIIYKILWNFFLKVYNTSITAYKNANTLSILNMITNLPKNIIRTYVYFFEYFTCKFTINSYPAIINVLFFSIIIFYVYDLFKMNKKNVIISIITFILIPIACNFSVLYIDAGVMLQQTLPTSMYIPILLSILFENNIPDCSMIKKIISIMLVITSSAYLFGNILATEKDIESMREGKISTNAIVNDICLKLINDGYCSKYDKFYFVGKPCNSSLFNVSDIWYGEVNEYAKFGSFSEDAFSMPNSYQGVINDLGYNIQCSFPSNQKFNELIENEKIINMPTYPDDNSIVIVDDYVVIKVADY